MCPVGTKLHHFYSICPFSYAPRGPHFNMSPRCASPHVPRGDQTSPFLQYMSLLICPAGATFQHVSTMCLSSCAPWGPNFTISTVYVPSHMPRGGHISTCLHDVPLLMCPVGTKLHHFYSICPFSYAP